MSKLIAVMIIILSAFSVFAAERIVILSPAAADIFYKLGADTKVVGVTKNVEEFPNAVKVGTHIRPNAELIRSLRPDLIITGSADSYYADSIKVITGAKVFKYDPLTLDEILSATVEIGKVISKEAEAEELIQALKTKLDEVKPLSTKPSVVYEVSQLPYTVAGKGNITTAIINAAGGYTPVESNDKLVKLSVEKVVAEKPDFYLWQTGPMNRNPVPPAQRPEFKRLEAEWIQVDEKKYSRANTVTFDAIIELNRILKVKYE